MTTPEFETILYDVDADDRVATITLNRPDVLNAFNRRMCEEVRDAWHLVKDDDRVHAVVLRAAGDPGLRARIGSKARERVGTHSLDSIAAAYSAAIEDVLEARGHLGAVEGSRAAPARVPR